MRPLIPFVLAHGLSVALVVAGALFDGVWDYASFLWMAWVTAALDHFFQENGPAPSERGARILSTVLGLTHFAVLPLAVHALAQGGFWLNWAVYFMAVGLFMGQIMNSTAHELIHTSGRFRRAVGRWIYVTLLFGHQTTAHPGIHHIWVATPRDSNTARYGESWWRFVMRAWHHSFWSGLALEKARLRRIGLHGWHRRNPYWQYLLGAGATMLAMGLWLGWAGLGAYFAICMLAQLQLLLTDYVLHYGMRRREIGEGRWEPVGPSHSWNSPHAISNLLTLHGPRHSDHHAHPTRGFEALRLDPELPMLPYALPVMVTLAFVPAVWRHVMNPRVDALHGQTLVSPEPPPSGDLECAPS
ncbi:alkane 1-monooxygenase [Jannaschia sp. W003]|uniref:alkane 1-monooxygenase n=1 Tax=Jannaschia sp. W003 TaxID=2867012 RepID=UPI0021A41287|nr:alkane 1-monooxygenase [Jannaschia sp. W003]UWQ23005.1 alkane 1-monooxygenase [Jannaschia sp. W003]